jgi:quercetin dioxygenase-like cupin family protein
MATETKTACVVPATDGRRMNVLGHAITVKLAAAETAGDCYSFEVVTPPGHGIPPHVHDREDEVIYVLDGEYDVWLDGAVSRATAGATLHFPRHVPHAFTNVGATPGTTLWVVTPGTNFEPFFDELGALPAGPPDLAKVAAIFGSYGMQILPPR